MLATVIIFFSLYVLVKLYVSTMQIGYISSMKNKEAVILSPRDYVDAASYAVAKERLSMATTFIEYMLFLFWMGGALSYIDSNFFISNSTFHIIAVVMGVIVINGVVMMPFEYYSKFKLDAKYGFNKSTHTQYIKDTLISTILMLLIGSAIVWVVSKIITSSELWWLWSYLFIMVVVIAINMLFPTFRALFFDKVTPLEDSELSEKIDELMKKTGFKNSGVFVSDASKRDSRLNAYFGGLGKTKRVILFDTLLEKLNSYELIAVLGHELGHFKHNDIYKNIAMVGFMLFIIFAIFGNLPEQLYLELGVAQTPQIIMALFILAMGSIMFFIMPLFGMMSRHNEYEADRAGSELGGAEHLVNALKKLVSENKSFPLSHSVYRFFYTTHPPVIDRLRELGYDIGNVDDDGYPCPA